MLKQRFPRCGYILAVLILGLVPLSRMSQVVAADLQTRSVRLDSSQVSATTIHVFNYGIPTTALVGSTVFEYCANNPFIFDPCTAPAGLDVSAANLDSESGDVGYSIDAATTANRLVLTRLPILSISGPAQYIFSNITNPSSIGTIYVRISLHASTDGSGPYSDGGSVAFATSRLLSTQAFVPPYLTFCVGITVAADCSSTNGSSINFGELSKVSANTATSQFAGASNDVTGFYTNIFGSTMTSGNNLINPLAVPTSNQPGTSQFGLNLRANTNPAVGQNPSGVGSSILSPDYANVNQFILKDGVLTNAPLSSDFNVFTVSYLVNVPSSQAPGVYNTTLTYVATASF
jgi:hypothetical protein